MAKKILIIDDEPDMVTFLCALLEDHGYVTITAADGEEGMTKIKSEKPDLISLDLLMPNKTGIKMFRRADFDSLQLESRPVGWAVAFEIARPRPSPPNSRAIPSLP